MAIALLSVAAYATSPTLQAVVSDVIIELNGQTLTLTDASGNEVKPLIVNGTTYLPVRAIGENLGLEVGWNGETRTVTLSSGTHAQAPVTTTPVVKETTPAETAAAAKPVSAVVTKTKKNELIPSSEDKSIGDIRIAKLNKYDEYIIIRNYGSTDVNLKGWTILSTRGDQQFTFPDYILKVSEDVKVGDKNRGTVDLHWLEDKGVWNNKKKDDANLFNAQGELVSTLIN